jgi:hypothetical protein
MQSWVPAPELSILDWSESTAAVYNARSASTHLISGEAADVLLALASAPTAADAAPPWPAAVLQSLADAGLVVQAQAA